jgi:hypothetical protein
LAIRPRLLTSPLWLGDSRLDSPRTSRRNPTHTERTEATTGRIRKSRGVSPTLHSWHSVRLHCGCCRPPVCRVPAAAKRPSAVGQETQPAGDRADSGRTDRQIVPCLWCGVRVPLAAPCCLARRVCFVLLFGCFGAGELADRLVVTHLGRRHVARKKDNEVVIE